MHPDWDSPFLWHRADDEFQLEHDEGQNKLHELSLQCLSTWFTVMLTLECEE